VYPLFAIQFIECKIKRIDEVSIAISKEMDIMGRKSIKNSLEWNHVWIPCVDLKYWRNGAKKFILELD